MKQKWYIPFVLGCIVWVGILEGGMVRLVNDSPYRLRAVIRANDGSFLGEVIIAPQTTGSWTDSYIGFPSNPNSLNTDRSQTPYTVFWYCPDGSPFSVTTPVPTGGTVSALTGEGAKQCRQRKKQQPGQNQDAPSAPPMQPSPQNRQGEGSNPGGMYEGPWDSDQDQ